MQFSEEDYNSGGADLHRFDPTPRGDPPGS
jgi:hypothetical protein